MSDLKPDTSENEADCSAGKTRLKFNFHLFERCSGGVLNLRFDSSVLESYYTLCSFPHSLSRFRIAVSYFALVCTAWLIFFATAGTEQWMIYVAGAAAGLVVAIVLFGLTCSRAIFEKNFLVLYIILALFFSLLFLLAFVPPTVGVSSAFNASLIVQLLLIIYINIPLRLWQVILICGPVSTIHVILSCTVCGRINARLICIYIILHLCTHMIGFAQHILSQVRRRSTFMRLGHSALMRKALEKEQQTQNEMILSLMPQKVANEVMQGSYNSDEDDEVNEDERANDPKLNGIWRDKKSTKTKLAKTKGVLTESISFSDDNYSAIEAHPLKGLEVGINRGQRRSYGSDVKMASPSAAPSQPLPVAGHAVKFRKFHVSQMENVSILFADIVGFTNMSSNKSASQLLCLLNDLFGRFDSLCEMNRCEKIATLGDCYYCVSGCPNAVPDHAERIVEMGRSMCVAIQQFDEDHDEQVNMRVGVHTGKVICGLVGTRRFKFDVWSNDVTLANQMESSGKAGEVHISETTLHFVKDIYEVSEGEPVPDIRKVKVLIEYYNKEDQRYAIKHTQDQTLIKTYFIKRRFDDKPVVTLDKVAPITEPKQSSNINVVKDQTISSVEQVIAPSIGSNELTLTTSPGAIEPEIKARGSDVEMLDALWNLSKPEEVFKFPPISPFSLCFLSRSLEQIYRRQVLRVPRQSVLVTLATPRLTPVTNGLVHFIFFILVSLACFVNFPNLFMGELVLAPPYIVFGFGLCLNSLFLSVIFSDMLAWNGFCPSRTHILQRFYNILFGWYARNIFGALMLCSPAAFVLANFQLCMFWNSRTLNVSTAAEFSIGEYRMVHGILFTFMLFNLTLFPNYSSWTKSLSATIICLTSCLLMHWPFQGFSYSCPSQVIGFSATTSAIDTNSPPVWLAAAESSLFPWEMTVILSLNLILIFFLNRDIDISFRVSFNRDFEASRAKKAISLEKMQGEWLLENIIPRFVLTDLRKTNKYSQHVKDAAVMFASIANFSEFYDEQYQGGQEMLRVLNEIFADFEHLLSAVRFKDVEKIKTIAECFMAASGLNLVQRAQNKSPDAHLYALMDFATELLKTLEDFNRQMFNFQFELKIGYNVGEVTAGVIGTTKLLYDIWGDTVNVASRMYSTGQKARIQVTEDVAQRLSSQYDFEYRGKVFVKGKGEMRTHLLIGRKADAVPY